MASSCLVFAQGQTATLTAQFVTTPSAMPIDVPDATIEIFGPSGSIILAATAMDGPVVTGLYYYDWVIPNSLPVTTYTVRFSGTVLGTPTAATSLARIEPAGSTAVQTVGQTRAVAALQRYIRCAQAIPSESEVLRRLPGGGDKTIAQWNKWNLTNPIIRLNDRILETGFTIDYDLGQITFPTALHETDIIDASYNFRFFSDEELVGFLNDALNIINLEPSGSSFTLDQMPDQVMGVLLHGAAANALQAMMFCIMFQKESTIFGGNDRAEKIFGQMETLKQNHLKIFEDGKRKVKISNWPRISATVTPEFTLPGGRCISHCTKSLYKISNETIWLTIEDAFKKQQAGKKLKVLADGPSGIPIFANVSKIWESGKKYPYLIKTLSGKKVLSSKEHLFFVNGKYAPAETMSQNDHLLSFSNTCQFKDKIASIRKLDQAVPMFDMEVPATENFFANGIKCHNSRWFRYLFSSNIS